MTIARGTATLFACTLAVFPAMFSVGVTVEVVKAYKVAQECGDIDLHCGWYYDQCQRIPGCDFSSYWREQHAYGERRRQHELKNPPTQEELERAYQRAMKETKRILRQFFPPKYEPSDGGDEV